MNTSVAVQSELHPNLVVDFAPSNTSKFEMLRRLIETASRPPFDSPQCPQLPSDLFLRGRGSSVRTPRRRHVIRHRDEGRFDLLNPAVPDLEQFHQHVSVRAAYS